MKYSKHIVFFCPGFPNDEKEKDCFPPMQNFIKGFSEFYPEIKITVISLFYPHEKKEYLWNSIQVYALGVNGLNAFKIVKYLRVYFAFKKIYNPTEETIIQSFWLSHCALIGQWIHSLFGIKHFCMVMGQDVRMKNKFRFILPKKKLVVCCPNQLSNQKLQHVFRRKADYIISRGIDETMFKDIPKNMSRDIDILGVGNLSALKNYRSFLRIIKNLKRKFKDINVILIGKGEEEKALKKFISENNLETNVTFLGYLSREDVLKIMSKSKILLHTSTFEDESYAITEALHSRMYAVGYNKVLSNRENLYLGNNEKELISICETILTDYQLPKKIAGYTINQMVNDFYKIYFS